MGVILLQLAQLLTNLPFAWFQVDTKVTAEFSPPSSGPNSPDMDKVKEDIVNIVMTVESGSDSESVSSISD